MLTSHELKQRLSYLVLGQRGGLNRVQILQALHHRPYNMNQLADTMGLNYRTVKHHLDTLLKHEIVSTSRTGGYGEVYFLTPEVEANLPLLEDLARKLSHITASPKLFQHIVEQTKDAIVMADPKLDVLSWNASAERVFGLPASEAIGNRLSVFPDLSVLKDAIGRISEGKPVVALETQARNKAGERIELELTLDTIRDEQNELVGYSMIARDITERKRALEALILSEQRYALAQRAAGVMSWERDLATDQMKWSADPESMFGGPCRTFDELLRRAHPDDREALNKAAQETLRTGKGAVEHRIIARDGSARWLSQTGGVVRDEGGKPVRMLGIVEDITERRDAEEKHSHILETTMEGFWMTDMKGRILEVNDAYCKMTGYSRRELLTMSISDIEAVEKPEETARHIKVVKAKGSDRFETRHRRKNGDLMDIDVSVSCMDIGGGRLVVFARDITQRKRAEEALRLSEQRYALAQKAASIGSWDWDITTGALKWSETIEPMFGFAREKFKGTYEAFLRSVHPDDRKNVEGSVQAALDKGKPYDIEHRIVWPDGTVRWMSEKGEVQRDRKGKPVRMLGVVQDITERKCAEVRIRHLASFPELNPRPILEVDFSGKVLFSNAATARVLKEAGLAGVGALIPADFKKVMANLKLRPGSTVSRDITLKDRVFQVDIFQPEDLELLRIYAVDVTERKRAEAALREANENLERRVEERTRALKEETAERARAEAAAKAERQRFNEVLETLPAYVVLLTPDYHVPFANRFFRERFGESRGRRCYEYLFKRDRPCENCKTYDALKNMAPLNWEWKGPDGHHYDIFDYPFKDVDGSDLILEMGMDITERKRSEDELRAIKDNLENLVRERTAELAASEERFRDLFQTMPQGVVYQDAAGNITQANPAAERILGLTLDQMKGRTSVHPDWRSVHEDGSPFPGEEHPSMVALRTGKVQKNMMMGVYNPLTKEQTWISISAVPQFRPGEEKPYQVFTTFDDITEKMKAPARQAEGPQRRQ